MITINGTAFAWEEGLTVTKLFEKKGYAYHPSRIVVKINDQVIAEDDYDIAEIQDGDEVLALHICAGG